MPYVIIIVNPGRTSALPDAAIHAGPYMISEVPSGYVESQAQSAETDFFNVRPLRTFTGTPHSKQICKAKCRYERQLGKI